MVSIEQYCIVENPSLWACIATPNDDFKICPNLFAHPNPINMTNMTRHHTQFPLTAIPTKQTSRQSSLAPPGSTHQ